MTLSPLMPTNLETVYSRGKNMDFILASKNNHKLKELNRILLPLGVNIKLESDLGIVLPEVDETGTTFEENAELKARSACKVSGLPAIADDSGMCVDGLDGAPGVYSARFAGEEQDDEANIDKVLFLLDGQPDGSPARKARFISSICCCFPDGRKLTATGACEGEIALERHGHNGFGYDPIFMVGELSFAEMTDEQKDKISHRGVALRQFAEIIKDYLED